MCYDMSDGQILRGFFPKRCDTDVFWKHTSDPILDLYSKFGPDKKYIFQESTNNIPTQMYPSKI